MILSNTQIRMFILSIIITLSLYGGIVFWTGFDDLIKSFQKINLLDISIILSLSLLNYLGRFLRWNYYINQTHKNSIPLLKHIMIYFSGFALTTTPAKAGETIRGIFLNNYNIDFKINIACFISERLSDLLAIIILCLCGFSYYQDYNYIILIGMIMILILLWFIIYPKSILYIKTILPQKKSIETIISYIYTILQQTQIYHKPLILCKTLFISIVAWSFEAYGFYYIVQIFDPDINLLQAFFIYAISMLIGGISFIPGGLGSSETTMIALLISNKIPLIFATPITILIRIATLWFAVFLGLISLSIISYKKT